MSNEVIQLTRDDMKKMVKETVHETLVSMGMDVDDPLEMQKDFQFNRRWRESSEKATSLTLKIILTTLVTGAIGWLAMHLKF